MATLSTAAWVLHDLGLAAGFGGPLFGKLALDPAIKVVHSEAERGEVMNKAWGGYQAVNAVALGTMAATWFVGRTMLSGWEVTAKARPLVLVKDALVGAALVTGVANMVGGAILAKQAPGGAVPVESGYEPSARTPRVARMAQRSLNVLGPLNIALLGGVIGVTAVLAMESSRSGRFGFVSRLLP